MISATVKKFRTRFGSKSDDQLREERDGMRAELRVYQREHNGRLKGQGRARVETLVAAARERADIEAARIISNVSTVDGQQHLALPAEPNAVPDSLVLLFVKTSPAFREWMVERVEVEEAAFASNVDEAAFASHVADAEAKIVELTNELLIREAEGPLAEAQAALDAAVGRAAGGVDA